MKKMLIILAVCALVTGLAAVAFAQPANAPGYAPSGATIWSSYHNLSVNGPNAALKANTVALGGTTEVCVFCHTPHNATTSELLWQKDMTNYTGVTMDFGQLLEDNEASLNFTNVGLDKQSGRCLTCHDGTTSVGQVNFAYLTGGATSPATIAMTGSDQTAGAISNPLFRIGNTRIGTVIQMQGNHPVSIPYPGSIFNGLDASATGVMQGNFITDVNVCAGGTYCGPATATASGDLLKGVAGAYHIECTSCHDTHGQQSATQSSSFPGHLSQMVRVGMDASALCVNCHIR